MTCETQAVFTCSSCTMAFGLAACHRPRGACAAHGLAERGLAADARTPQRRLQALPPAPLTVQRAGKPDPCKESACEIPYHAGAALEEQTWGARQPHKHRGVSKHEFPPSLHIRDLEQKKGKLSQPHVLQRAGGVPCPGSEHRTKPRAEGRQRPWGRAGARG